MLIVIVIDDHRGQTVSCGLDEKSGDKQWVLGHLHWSFSMWKVVKSTHLTLEIGKDDVMGGEQRFSEKDKKS